MNTTQSALLAPGRTEIFPPLPLEEWVDTKQTLHRLIRIVGKIRLRSMPRMNHWWHVTLYVTPWGLTTGPMPHSAQSFEIDFDFIRHKLLIATSEGADRVTREAYSHEVIAFGFWPGDDNTRAPAYYSYTAPDPEGYANQQLRPEAAYFGDARGNHMALLMYDDLRRMDPPREALLDLFERRARRARLPQGGIKRH